MAWSNQCPHGGPANFNPTAAVNGTNFNNAVFVQVSAQTQVTKKAFAYYNVGGFRICVVADVHRQNTNSPWNIAGNCWIPGWDNWQMTTPNNVVQVVGGLQPGGAYPGNNRFPQPLQQNENG